MAEVEEEVVWPVRDCPTCGREDVRVIDGKVERHQEPGYPDPAGRNHYCRRAGFDYLRSEGWLVLTRGHCPVRVEEEDIDTMSVQYFDDELAARRWIEEHPKAKGAYAVEMKGQP